MAFEQAGTEAGKKQEKIRGRKKGKEKDRERRRRELKFRDKFAFSLFVVVYCTVVYHGVPFPEPRSSSRLKVSRTERRPTECMSSFLSISNVSVHLYTLQNHENMEKVLIFALI